MAVQPFDIIHGQPAYELGPPLYKVFEPVSTPENLDAIIDGFYGNGADDPIDSRRRPAADQKRQFVDAVR
jgi:hypothetical protein